jgi:WD40 repeat protein
LLDDFAMHEWDLTKRRETRSFPTNGVSGPFAFSQDERWFFTGGWDGDKGVLRDMTTGRESQVKFNINNIQNVAFSPDGRLLAAASELSLAKVWETTPFREVATLRGFLQTVHSVGFSPDGTRLATSSDEKEAIRLWDLESRQQVLTLEGQDWGFMDCQFSPDGKILASMNYAGILHLWQAPSWQEIEEAEKAQPKVP